jgi:hypothetical protein
MEETLEFVRSLDFFSTIIAAILFALMFGGFWQSLNADKWMGRWLIALGIAVLVGVIYSKHTINEDPDASELMYALSEVPREYLLAGAIGGIVVGWLLGSLRVQARRKSAK